MMSSHPKVAIVDYRTGNTHSVARSLLACGIQSTITAEPAEIAAADGLIMPGVGAFGPAMQSLMESGAAHAIRHYIEKGKPVLAICLGMQLLADESEEGGHHLGLGVIAGRVRRLHDATHGEKTGAGRGPKVPQIAWNRIHPAAAQADWSGSVLADLAGQQMYFLHSFVLEPSRAEDRLAETDYAGDRFCSAIRKGSVTGVQFHPELSADAGRRLFRTFAASLQQA